MSAHIQRIFQTLQTLKMLPALRWVRVFALATLVGWGWQAQAQTHQVSTATELRALPKINARIVQRLTVGTPVQELQVQGGWLQVSTGGQEGWLRSTHVQSLANLPAPEKQQLASLFTATSNRPIATTGTRGVEMEDGGDALAQLQAHAVDEEQAREFARQAGLQGGTARPDVAATAYSKTEQQQLGEAFVSVLLAEHSLQESEQVQQYVNQLGRWLALQTIPRSEDSLVEDDWYFAVLNQDAAQLYAAPGGYVLISRGLLQQAGSEQALAAALVQGILQSHAAEQATRLQHSRADGAALLASITQAAAADQALTDEAVQAIRQLYADSTPPQAGTANVDAYLQQAGYGAQAVAEAGLTRLRAAQQQFN